MGVCIQEDMSRITKTDVVAPSKLSFVSGLNHLEDNLLARCLSLSYLTI